MAFRTALQAIALPVLLSSGTLSASAQAPQGLKQYLPPATDFQLTIREGASGRVAAVADTCGGDAADSVPCRAFTITLENRGVRTIEFAYVRCSGAPLSFEALDTALQSPYGMPISGHRSGKQCASPASPADWEEVKIAPGQKRTYERRMVSDEDAVSGQVWAPVIAPISIRAQMDLFGCTEETEGTSCMHPGGPSMYAPYPWGQAPVRVTSNELRLGPVKMPDLPAMRFVLELQPGTGPITPRLESATPRDCGAASESLACKMFHYRLRNVSGHTVILYRWTCQPDGPYAEVARDGDDWTQLKSRWSVCGRNFMYPVAVKQGEVLEDNLQLISTRDEFDLSTFRAAAKYRLKINFAPVGCFASPDGMFCLEKVHGADIVVSNELQVDATVEGPEQPHRGPF